jgi:hypothetical protein
MKARMVVMNVTICSAQPAGGCAVLAYPATYGSSGVMTFIVNHNGDDHQRDLGPRSAKIARSVVSYDPGPGWKKAA